MVDHEVQQYLIVGLSEADRHGNMQNNEHQGCDAKNIHNNWHTSLHGTRGPVRQRIHLLR